MKQRMVFSVLLGSALLAFIAFAIDRGHPDPQSPDQGIAFSAVVSKDGVDVSNVDTEVLARFVGTGAPQGETLETEGGVGCEGRQLPNGAFSCVRTTCAGACKVYETPEHLKYCDCEPAPQE